MENIMTTQGGALAGRLRAGFGPYAISGAVAPAWSLAALAVCPIPTDNSTGVSVPGRRYCT